MQCFNEVLRILLFETSLGWYPIWNLLHIRTNAVSLGRNLRVSPSKSILRLRGESFDVSKNVFSLRSFVTSFKTVSLKSDLIYNFFKYTIFFFMI